MTRKEKVYTELSKLCENITLTKIKEGFCGFDAATIGEKVGISRNNASKELNSLVVDKRVIKILGRPVYFFNRTKLEELLNITLNDNHLELKSFSTILKLKKQPPGNKLCKKNIFDKIIGSQGSLKIPIEQAKAAILYPPRGLNTLLIGPTGVGKTTFAEMMYRYALETGRFITEAKFNIFNCAEYANNPQLLLSQLFGYAKGAFTGAEKDKAGFIEKSQGGILLLDEIHRLPPEGQEMLFLLMDKNIYRRLGETENSREANVLLIGATTEDINSTLLKTFLRRIPVIIRLPSFLERPISERLLLIKQFFKDEVKRVQVPIKVCKNVIKAFLLYDCQGNIGQLKGDIQLTCARGFLYYKTSEKNLIQIDTSLLPEHVYQGLFNSQADDIVKQFELDKKEYYDFSQSDNEEFVMRDEYNMSRELYQEIGDKYTSYAKKGYSHTQINKMINTHIEKYVKKLLEKCNVAQEIPANEELFKIVSPRIYYAVDAALKVAENKLHKSFNKKVYIALTLHISALIERIVTNKTIHHSKINEIALNNPDEFQTATLVKEKLEEKLEIDIPREEIGFIAMLLYAVNLDDGQKYSKIGVIVLAHGKSTASSIANVANNILGTNHCRAIDIPLDKKVEDILDMTTILVKEIHQGKGVLLLVDMDSLVDFAEIITKKTKIKTMSLEMIATPIVIEACRKSILSDVTLTELIEELKGINPYTKKQITTKVKQKGFSCKVRTIITTCFTGEGSAVKIVEMLKNALPVIEKCNIKVKPITKEEFRTTELPQDEEIIAVVGTVNLKIPTVPYISLDEIIIGDGFRKIEKLIMFNDNEGVASTNVPNYLVEKVLKEYLTFLDPCKTYKIVDDTFKKLNELITIKDYKKMKIKYIVHSCCMVERLVLNKPMAYKNVKTLIQNKNNLYRAIRKSLVLIEETFNIKIPDTEVGYIIDIFDTQ